MSSNVIYNNFHQIMNSQNFCNNENVQWLNMEYLPYLYQLQQLFPYSQYHLNFICYNSLQKSESSIHSTTSAFSEYQEHSKQPQLRNFLMPVSSNNNEKNISEKTISFQNLQKQQQSKNSLYQANLRQEKEINKLQKEGRNKFSNILRTFFKFLHEKNKMVIILRKIIVQKKLDILEGEFFEWFNSCCPDYRNYIRPKIAKKLFNETKSPKQYAKIMRCLLFYYITRKYPLYLFNSGKMTKKSCNMHLKGSKELLALMFSL